MTDSIISPSLIGHCNMSTREYSNRPTTHISRPEGKVTHFEPY